MNKCCIPAAALPLIQRLAVDPVPPEVADPVSKMTRELTTRKGRAL